MKKVDPADKEPDVRFTFANERTFLAWNRTAVALIATGIAATQLLPEFQLPGGRRLLGLPLVVLGGLGGRCQPQVLACQRKADSRRRPLPRAPMPFILTGGIALVGLIAAIRAAFGGR